MNESYVGPTSKYPIDPMWEVTSKYYIDRLWEEYHKVKKDLAAVRIEASSAWQEYHKMKEELADTKCKLGQMDDYVDKVLKLELADTKLKLKMAHSAWDELDKSHASRAKLHDELIIAEGQRDQAKMRANRADDYINETLKPQLADAKKSAQIAWDELDIFRITNAKLHDELIIVEGQRDQSRAERDALKAEVDTLRAQHAPPRMVTGWCAECKGSGHITTHSSSANGGSVTTRKCSCGGAPLLINATADFWSVQSSKENTHES